MKKERKTAYAALRRGMAFLCTLVLTLLAVTLPAEAVVDVKESFNVPNIGLSDSGYKEGTPLNKNYKTVSSPGTGTWTADHTTITGTVTPAERTRKIGVNYYCCEAGASSTLTITNTSREACLLTFSYAPPTKDGTLSFSPEIVASDGTCRATLAPSEFVTVTLTTSAKTDWSYNSDPKKYTTIATLSNIEWTSMNTNIEVTLAQPTNGNYTVMANGEELKVGEAHNMPRNTEYIFTAIPDPEYNFVGWYVDDQKRSEGLTFRTGFTDSCTVEAKFVSKNAALFKTGGELFYDLNEAVAYAQANRQQQITLESNGKITGHYTIPAGITLLIPFDEAGTLYAAKPESMKDYVTPSVFRKMTMASGSSITVNGAISVGGMHCHTMGSLGPSGPYGQIDMAAGSAITLNSGANLYAWGFITGDGQITATPNATVYEYFQVKDWRGGTATSGMLGNKEKVFPLSQYYVQNIEAALTIQAGAAERTYISISVKVLLFDTVQTATIDFIGSTNSLFRLGNGGTLTKKYDPKTDRITYTTTGTASLASLALDISSYKMNSKDYVLPVNSNMTLNILSGSVAVNSDAALLPGAQINIAKDAELNIESGKSLYVYDYNIETGEWGPYCINNKEFVPVNYSPSGKGTRTLTDATIDVNGTLTAAGSVYTTASGANICSSEGTGRFIQTGGPGTGTTTHQCTQADRDITYVNIPITPAQLKNAAGADEPYTKTSTASAGDTFTYCTGSECGGGKWVKNLQVAEIIDSTGTQKPYPTLQEAVDAYTPDDNTAPKNYIKLLHSTTENITTENVPTNKDLYLDLNGCTVTGDFTMNRNTLYGMDSSVKGYVTAPRGKIVGGVSYYAKTYETPPTENKEYDRYVAILGAENGTSTLSFHRFNISVTGYRFELAAPQCALIFCGKFQGDDAAKNYLKSLGFTLTGDNSTESKNKMSDASNREFVKKEGDAYLFELYLIRSFEKNSSDKTAYTEEFSATARATFKNGGTQDSGPKDSETKDSKTQYLSFQKAWQNALDPNSDMEEKDQEILRKFLKEFGINIYSE